MDFYTRVRHLAKEKRSLSLQEFVFSVGLNLDTYNSMRKAGNLPRADEAFIIAQALGTSVEYLLTGVEPENAAKSVLCDIRASIDQYLAPSVLSKKSRK